jgi:K+-transporting ATPase c subunit
MLSMENRIVGSLVMNTCGDHWVNVLRLNLALDALAPKVR